jgi:predicted nucleic acid-binding protein
MTLLDAYALIALLVEEPAAGEVETILRGGDASVVVVNLAEAIDVSQRAHGLAHEDVRAILDPLLGDTIEVVSSDESHAWVAAELRTRHYDRRTSALSLADCLLLAHARADGDRIATPDPPLANAARAEDLEVVGLPDSAGERP